MSVGTAAVAREEDAGAGQGSARRRLAVLTLTALGIVYGDIGTSPLYALREWRLGAEQPTFVEQVWCRESAPQIAADLWLHEKGERLLSIHYMVKTLRLNAPVEPARFTIPSDDAQTMIDEDVPTFLKHRQLTHESPEEK
jgi:hypothetical protein